VDIDKKAVGGRIRELREARGIEQVELAQRVGTNARQLWRWEKGEQLIGTIYLARVASELGVSPHRILYGLPPEENAWETFLLTPDAQTLTPESLERLRTQRLEFLGGAPTVEDYRELARLMSKHSSPADTREAPPPHNLRRLPRKRT
jgi:transcriptional regulator with XRE-family HTH domain